MECTDDESVDDGFPDNGGESSFEFVGSFVGETDDAEVGWIDAESNEVGDPRREHSRLPLCERRGLASANGDCCLLTLPGPARICSPPAIGWTTAVLCSALKGASRASRSILDCCCFFGSSRIGAGGGEGEGCCSYCCSSASASASISYPFISRYSQDAETRLKFRIRIAHSEPLASKSHHLINRRNISQRRKEEGKIYATESLDNQNVQPSLLESIRA